jgi:CheY-like chemotaxis protein
MTCLLEGHGHVVTPVSYGEDAVTRACAPEPPDLIVMDLQLVGGIDGFQTLSQIRAIEQLADVPVLAVTAFAMAGDRQQALAAGFAAYISKPINPYTFVLDIERFLPPPLHGAPVPVTDDSVEPEPEHEPAMPPRTDLGRILILDDQPTNIDLLRTILRPHGYLVAGASTLDEALAAAHANHPVLVLADLHNSRASGVELQRRFGDDPTIADPPIVFLATSAFLDDLPAHTAIIRGPIEPARLLEQVRELIAASAGNRGGRRHQRYVAFNPYASTLRWPPARHLRRRPARRVRLRRGQSRAGPPARAGRRPPLVGPAGVVRRTPGRSARPGGRSATSDLTIASTATNLDGKPDEHPARDPNSTVGGRT